MAIIILKLFKGSFFISLLFLLTGVLMKLMDLNGFELLLKKCALISLVYIVIGILSILESKEKSHGQKVVWVLGFIFLSVVTGMLFYQTQLKRQTENINLPF